MEIIENLFSASEEIILERKLEDTKGYKEFSSENDIAFKKLICEIRALTDPEKRKKLEKLLFKLQQHRSKAQKLCHAFCLFRRC